MSTTASVPCVACVAANQDIPAHCIDLLCGYESGEDDDSAFLLGRDVSRQR